MLLGKDHPDEAYEMVLHLSMSDAMQTVMTADWRWQGRAQDGRRAPGTIVAQFRFVSGSGPVNLFV